MNIDWTLAGAVVLSGLLIVFAALTILIALVYLLSAIMRGVSKPKTPPPSDPGKKITEAPKTAPAPTTNKPAMAVQNGIEEETVSVISAAVAYMMGQSAPQTAYAVTNISRAGGSRPVWGFAGMQQNTRPF